VHRKVVTVLFRDVVGSTALGESVDPEAQQGLPARSPGKTAEAIDALEQALERCGRKKNLAMIAQVQPRLEGLRVGATA
jgi:hypothetical protein